MKKIVLVLVAAMVLLFTGCEKKETISMPFDVDDVNNIEMYRNAEPYSAEKQVITESEDIADLYSLFSGLEVSDKKTEPVVGETITSFRFNLSDDTSYEIIYCAEAVKSGRLKFPAEKLDYFTSADIGGRWDSYQYEIVPVSESELPGQSENPSDPPLEETHEWDKIPMVMVDGKLYYDTGAEQKVQELKEENQRLQQKIPSTKEKLKEAQERQRLENQNRKLLVQVECLEQELEQERSFSARLLDGVSAVMDFLDRHLPEKFRPLVERARELLPVSEVQQPEQEQERGHTWGGMEL